MKPTLTAADINANTISSVLRQVWIEFAYSHALMANR